jgi:hypothetical protein
MAFNVFREAIHSLTERHLPAQLRVHFAPSQKIPAWAINASVFKDPDGPNGFVIEFPELLPTFLMLYAHIVAPVFDLDAEVAPDKLHGIVQSFFDVASQMVRTYREEGIGIAIRTAYASKNLSFWDIQSEIDHFDALSYLVSNHEVAHVYIAQLTDPPTNAEDRKAFEHLADLVATEWQFRRFIFLTPDSEDYRKQKGVGSHAEAVFDNCCACLEVHFSLLLVMGFSGAQQSGGRFHLESGAAHPGGFVRFWLQVHWLLSAVENECKSTLGEDLHNRFNMHFQSLMSKVTDAGLVNRNSLPQIWNPEDARHVARAAEIAQERNIEEIKPGTALLAGWAERAQNMATRIAEQEGGGND